MVSRLALSARPARPARPALPALLALALLAGCGAQTAAPHRHDALTRDEFNRRAASQFLPLYWRADSNHDGALQPAELAILWGLPDSDENRWIDQSGDFSNRFEEAYAALVNPPAAGNETERKHHAAVLAELDQGKPTLVLTDLRRDDVESRAMVRHLLHAAELIEKLYAREKGVYELEARVPAEDLASRAVFHRNQSPYCEAPATVHDPDCGAILPLPPRVFGLYPAALQKDSGFCDQLAAAPNAAALMDHFSVVVEDRTPGTYTTQPFSSAWHDDMQGVADALDAAAQSLKAPEAALATYLRAAAHAFRTNDWIAADRAWVAMSSTNSKWYVRVAPDEVYYEPCAWKAGFALQLARINPQSLEWQKKLEPLKQSMEEDLAQLAGAPYAAREVHFKLPDFIDVVVNAGDERAPTGATVGQSLPNWGPVAESGGRTTVMTNLFTDPDSLAREALLEASVFCKATNEAAGDFAHNNLVASLLHEAAHNLGPAHDYLVNGASDAQALGGPLAATFEELKAQNSSAYLTSWLAARGQFSAEEARQIERSDIAWALSQISRGMYAANGTPHNYSQLAAIQLGSFMDAGAITWRAQQTAANGTDPGCLEVDFGKLPAAVQSLESRVLGIKARADKAAAEQLKHKYADSEDAFAAVRSVVTQRWLRAPKVSFVYSIEF